MSADCFNETDQWEVLPGQPNVQVLRPACDCTRMDESWWDYLREGDLRYLLGPRDWPRDRCAWCGGFLIHSENCRELRASWLVMPWGKHKGEAMKDIESTYLAWALTRGDEELKRMAHEELRGRDFSKRSDRS